MDNFKNSVVADAYDSDGEAIEAPVPKNQSSIVGNKLGVNALKAQLGKSLIQKKNENEMDMIDKRDLEGIKGPRCLGFFSIKCAFFTFMIIDVLLLALLITMVVLEYFTSKAIIYYYFICMIPCILASLVLLIEDTALTRKIYYLTVAFKVFFTIVSGPIFVIRLDNTFLVNFTCSKIFNQDIPVYSVMEMSMLGQSAAINLDDDNKTETPVDPGLKKMCVEGVVLASVFAYIIINSI